MKITMKYMVLLTCIVGMPIVYAESDVDSKQLECALNHPGGVVEPLYVKSPIIMPENADQYRVDGRTYYESLIEKAVERTWALPITLYGRFTDGGFDSEGQRTSFGQQSFGGFPKIRDIYLFSKLTDDNFVRIENTDALGFQRGDTPLGAIGEQFGNFRDDQYTTFLASSQVQLDADIKEFGALISLMHRWAAGCERKLEIGAGITLPIKSVVVDSDVNFVGGTLFTEAFAADQTQREDSTKQFFREFVDVFDFFQSAVLAPKGMAFAGRQRKVGLGDATLFTYLDFGRYYESASSVQLGMNLIVPTAGKNESGVLFAPGLGNGGAVQVDFFSNIQWESPLEEFNPTIRAAVQLSGSATSQQRIPQIKTSGNNERVSVSAVRDLSTPQLFQAFHVDPYEQLDTTISGFGDSAKPTTMRTGTKYFFAVGNYFYNMFDVGFRLGLMYNFMHKSKDKIIDKSLSKCSHISNLVTKNTVANSHAFSWSLAYQFDSMIELNIGSHHMFAGKNIPRSREFFGSLVITF